MATLMVLQNLLTVMATTATRIQSLARPCYFIRAGLFSALVYDARLLIIID